MASTQSRPFKVSFTYSRSTSYPCTRFDLDVIDQYAARDDDLKRRHNAWIKRLAQQSAAFEEDVSSHRCALLSYLREVLQYHHRQLQAGSCQQHLSLEDERKMVQLHAMIQQLIKKMEPLLVQSSSNNSDPLECWQTLHALRLYDTEVFSRINDIMSQLD